MKQNIESMIGMLSPEGIEKYYYYLVYAKNSQFDITFASSSNVIDFPNDESMAGNRLLFATWATTSNISNRLVTKYS